MKKVILTTGGTGGHIYPALAVADKLKAKGIEPIFIGSTSRMEKDIVPQSGHKFIGIDIVVPRSFKNIKKYISSIREAYRIVKEIEPDAIIGFGNYISIPTIIAGIFLKKKIYLQEQNVSFGMANKLFYKFAKLTFLAFDKTYDDIPIKHQGKFKVTGNPLRKSIEGLKYALEREKLGIKPEQKLILITGGSLGAQDIVVYWATGNQNFEEMKKDLKYKKEQDVIDSYFNNILNIMAAADLVMCRAGALTISEIIELERPSVILPYSSAKVGQYENAKVLSDNESAYIYMKNEMDEAVQKVFALIKNDEKLKKMRIRLKSLKKSNAAEEIIANLDIWRN